MNTFFASEGLDIDFGEENKKVDTIVVSFGNLSGTLNSIQTGQYTVLQFFTQDIEASFDDVNKAVNNFNLKFNKKIYEFPLKQYNYTLTPSGSGMLVKIEELKDEKEQTLRD